MSNQLIAFGFAVISFIVGFISSFVFHRRDLCFYLFRLYSFEKLYGSLFLAGFFWKAIFLFTFFITFLSLHPTLILSIWQQCGFSGLEFFIS
jgi:hypothetical protein